MTVEDVTKAVSNLALAFGDDDADPGAMVSHRVSLRMHAELLILDDAKSS